MSQALACGAGQVFFAAGPALKGGGLTTALMHGALFGLFTYVTYDLNNQATLRNWASLIVSISQPVMNTTMAIAASGSGASSSRYSSSMSLAPSVAELRAPRRHGSLR